jgi:uncharacterized protein YndB with AHSA1/START domain
VINRLEDIARQVSETTIDGEAYIHAKSTRTYASSPKDVWDALSNPERLQRWFAAVSGDLKTGGEFEVENNASGTILRCDAPTALEMTWGDPLSVVQVTLEDATKNGDEQTLLTLEHRVPKSIAQNGAGVLFVGPGWDAAFTQLTAYLEGSESPKLESAEDQKLSLESMSLWGNAVVQSGTATEQDVQSMKEMLHSHWAPEIEV